MEDYYDIDAILAEDQVDKRAATPFGIQLQLDQLRTGS